MLTLSRSLPAGSATPLDENDSLRRSIVMFSPKPEMTAVGMMVPPICSTVPVPAKTMPPDAMAPSSRMPNPPELSVMPYSVPLKLTSSVPPFVTVALVRKLLYWVYSVPPLATTVPLAAPPCTYCTPPALTVVA